MGVTIIKPETSVILTKVDVDALSPISAPVAQVILTPFDGGNITLAAQAGAEVALAPTSPPLPATIELLSGGLAEAIVVLDFSKGPKGDPGEDGVGGGSDAFERVNTDISGVWLETFYVQDANTAGDWNITKIDGSGNSTVSYSDDSFNSGLSVAQAWADRLTLSYT